MKVVVTNMLHYYLKYGFLTKIMQNVSYHGFFSNLRQTSYRHHLVIAI